jgi:hypothetical protein
MDIVLENVAPGRTGHLRLLPNINRSGRVLPDTPSADDFTKNAQVDRELPVRRLSDRELYSLMIDISPDEAKANPGMTLEIAFNPALFLFLDASGRPLPDQADTPFTADKPYKIDLDRALADNTKARGLQYLIEAQTFAGSPLLDPKDSLTIGFRIRGANGAVLLDKPVLAKGDIRTADVILLGDDATPQRVFMCDVGENGPSITEFTAAAKAAGVPLTVIPIDIGMGDAWIQDQFQIGYTATAEGSQMVIVHLPRLASDSAIVPGTANLRNFVETYFPSNDIGVIKDFWKLPIPIADGAGGSVTLNLPQSYLAYKLMATAPRILNALVNLLTSIDKTAKIELPKPGDIFATRLAIDALYARLAALGGADDEQRAKIKDARAAIDRLSSVLATSGATVKLRLSVGDDIKTLTYASDTAERLQKSFNAIDALHSSTNYGGNIEVSPKTSDAPYGKILAGSVSSADLTNFLTSRGSLHPLVTANTSWLEVGHIDEIASFVSQSDGFSLLRASPKLALKMLDKLVALQGQGTLVTRLLRGKKWVHKAVASATDPIRPPNAFIKSVTAPLYDLKPFDTPIPKTANPKFGDGAYHDDRQYLVLNRMPEVEALYAAMITCADMLALCRDSNRTIEDFFLADGYAYADQPYNQAAYTSPAFLNNRDDILPKRLDKVVGEAFPGVKTYGLPVLFDCMRSGFGDQVSAVTPAMINFQTLNKTAVMPRPYGPRMRVPDAIAFVSAVIAEQGYPKTATDAQFITSRGLDKTWHWTRSGDGVARADLANLPTPFDKEYKQRQALLVSRIAEWLDPLAKEFMRLQLAAEGLSPIFDVYAYRHENDPYKNHPVMDQDDLRRIAGYFRDGFDAFKNAPVDYCSGDTEDAHPKSDKYDTDIKDVMDKIAAANPGVFDRDGNIIPTDWTKIEIPEGTVDVFELYTQALMEWLGMSVQWVDSWYYHTHKGGIHCGTNVLRVPQ